MSQRRILTISKPYVSLPYRKKLELLARDHGFAVGLICPTQWGFQVFEPPAQDSLVWTRSLPTIFSHQNHLHLYRSLRARVEEFRPHVVNVEEEDYSLVTWQAFRAAKRVKAKMMFYAWQNIYKHYPPPFLNVEHYVYRHASAAVGGSDNAGEILRKKGYRGDFYTVPQIGIDLDAFMLHGDPVIEKPRLKEQVNLDPKKFTVFFAGRIVYEKGVQTLIEAARLVRRDDLHILVVGSGPFLENLKRLAAQVLAPQAITFLPYVPTSEIAAYVKAADALCLGSLTMPNWKEQGPVRILTESLAAKAVAIVSDSGELPGVVGDAGLIFPEGDALRLSHRIAEVMDNPGMSSDLREKGQKRVIDHYSAEAVARDYARIFDRL